VLELAAREADIIGVHCALRERELGPAAAEDLAADHIACKLGWVRAELERVGRPIEDVELQFSVYMCRITDSISDGEVAASSFASLLAADPQLIADSPAVLCGTIAQCVDRLQELRQRYGFTYFNLGSDVEAVSPLLARLAGT